MTSHGEDGFTLLELLVSTTIMAIVVGAIATGLFIGFRTLNATSSQLAQSTDAQFVANYLVPDAQSGNDTSTSDATCGGGTAVIRFTWVDWTDLAGSVGTTQRVSYAYFGPASGETTGTLVRSRCTGVSTTPVAQSTVARYVATAPSPICTNAPGTAMPCTSTPSVKPYRISLTLTARQPSSTDYTYTVTATRRDS